MSNLRGVSKAGHRLASPLRTLTEDGLAETRPLTHFLGNLPIVDICPKLTDGHSVYYQAHTYGKQILQYARYMLRL